MINTSKWVKTIEERTHMLERLKLYHVNLPLTRFELEELKELIKEYEELLSEADDGK